jgi:hypothetical protein
LNCFEKFRSGLPAAFVSWVTEWVNNSIAVRTENLFVSCRFASVLFDNLLLTRRIDMRFISIFKHGPSQPQPTEAQGALMHKLIEEGMKAGWLLGIDGVDDDITGVRVNKDSDGKITVIDGPFA